MNKSDKVFINFKKKHKVIFSDPDVVSLLKDHIDSNGAIITFILALLENKINESRVINHIEINKEEWLELFSSFYKDSNIIEVYKKIEINPVVPLEQIIDSFNCLSSFINKLIAFLKNHQFNLNIDEQKLHKFFQIVFTYILYNKIECKVAYSFTDILKDKEYETKYSTILNNTKLFGLAKQEIINHCNNKINDLIVLLLGLTNKFNLDN